LARLANPLLSDRHKRLAPINSSLFQKRRLGCLPCIRHVNQYFWASTHSPTPTRLQFLLLSTRFTGFLQRNTPNGILDNAYAASNLTILLGSCLQFLLYTAVDWLRYHSRPVRSPLGIPTNRYFFDGYFLIFENSIFGRWEKLGNVAR